jgi:phosphatidylglycerophosphatase A
MNGDEFMNDLKQLAIEKLNQRGVSIKSIAEITYQIQAPYNNNITIEFCEEIINIVLEKREVIYAVLTGIALDEGAEKNMFNDELNNLIQEDSPLFGIDEILALSIVNVYGSIALTNFGYLDKLKPLIIGKIDKLGKETSYCSTFLDDIVGAIAAAAASKIAHEQK